MIITNLCLPKPVPLAPIPVAKVLFLSNQNAILTTAVTYPKPNPKPAIIPNVIYNISIELLIEARINPEADKHPPRIVIFLQPYLSTKLDIMGPTRRGTAIKREPIHAVFDVPALK